MLIQNGIMLSMKKYNESFQYTPYGAFTRDSVQLLRNYLPMDWAACSVERHADLTFPAHATSHLLVN